MRAHLASPDPNISELLQFAFRNLHFAFCPSLLLVRYAPLHRHRITRRISTTLGILAAVLAAATARANADAPAVDFESSFARVVIKNCVGCHNSSEANGGLD